MTVTFCFTQGRTSYSGFNSAQCEKIKKINNYVVSLELIWKYKNKLINSYCIACDCVYSVCVYVYCV